jgi:hypothetical protein
VALSEQLAQLAKWVLLEAEQPEQLALVHRDQQAQPD